MRPEAQVNMGYVPTPETVCARIAQMLEIPAGSYALDPCAGDGEAFRQVAPTATRHGVELDPARGREAQRKIQHMIVGDGTTCRVSHDAFGLLFLNPPYGDSTAGRTEKVFLDRCTPYLAPEGVLVLIIPATRYRHVAETLRRRYRVCGHWRFPDGHYDGPHDDYGQTVLIATKRRQDDPGSMPTRMFWTDELGLPMGADRSHDTRIPASQMKPLPETWNRAPIATVPWSDGPKLFTAALPDHDTLADMLRNSPVPRRMRLPPQVNFDPPPLPLRKGHIALTLASGLINGVYGDGRERHVAKGIVTRKADRKVEPGKHGDGNQRTVTETVIESFTVSVRALLSNGTIRTLSDTGAKS